MRERSLIRGPGHFASRRNGLPALLSGQLRLNGLAVCHRGNGEDPQYCSKYDISWRVVGSLQHRLASQSRFPNLIEQQIPVRESQDL
jgi:hypothetical protein